MSIGAISPLPIPVPQAPKPVEHKPAPVAQNIVRPAAGDSDGDNDGSRTGRVNIKA